MENVFPDGCILTTSFLLCSPGRIYFGHKVTYGDHESPYGNMGTTEVTKAIRIFLSVSS